MADKEHELTEEERRTAIEWLTERASGGPKCVVCGNNTWTLGRHFVATPIHTRQHLQLGGPTYPHIVIICGNCGHTLFFNAVRMGFLAGETEDKMGERKDTENEKVSGTGTGK